MSVERGTIAGNVGGVYVSAEVLLMRCDVKGCDSRLSWINAVEPDFNDVDGAGWTSDGGDEDHCKEHKDVLFKSESGDQ